MIKKAHSSWLIVLLILFAISYQLSAVSAFADDWSMGDWKNAELELVDGFENYVGNDWKNAELELIDGYDTTEEGYSQFYASLTSTLVPERAVDKTITFIRATTATVFDFEGLLKTAISGEARFEGARRVANKITKSQEIDHTNWVKTGVTVSATDIIAPDGTATAEEVSGWAGTSSAENVKIAIVGERLNRTYRWTVWIKTASGTSNKKISLESHTSITVTNTWQRFSKIETYSSAGIANPAIYDGSDAGTVYVWGAMIEDVTGQANQNPSEYVSCGVESAPYHGAGVDCVKYFETENGNTVASNVVTEATGAAIPSSTLKGYLAEGQRTNSLLQSENFATTWIAENVVVTANQIASPEGTLTADLITLNAGTSFKNVKQNVTGANTKTYSFFVKDGTQRYVQILTGTVAMAVNFDLQLGTFNDVGGSPASEASITELSNGWWRIQMTGTGLGSSVVLYVAGVTSLASGRGSSTASTGTFYLWGGQDEVGTFASSYIPTTTVAVTRNADALSYPDTNFDVTQGTILMSVIIPNSSSGQRRLVSTRVTSGSIPMLININKVSLFDATAMRDGIAFTASSSKQKLAVSWGGTTTETANSGSVGTTGSFDGTMDLGDINALAIAHQASDGNETFGNISEFKIWKRQLPNATLVTETTW